PASPFARRSSARRASARLSDSSSEMKAFNSRSFAIRSRQARGSSTEEILLAASAPESSVSVELSRLLNDLGDEVEVFFHGRGDGLEKLPLVAFGDLVRAQPLHHVEGMRHRLRGGRMSPPCS